MILGQVQNPILFRKMNHKFLTTLLTLKTIPKKYWELLRNGAAGQKFAFETCKLFQNGTQKKIFLSSFV